MCTRRPYHTDNDSSSSSSSSSSNNNNNNNNKDHICMLPSEKIEKEEPILKV